MDSVKFVAINTYIKKEDWTSNQQPKLTPQRTQKRTN